MCPPFFVRRYVELVPGVGLPGRTGSLPQVTQVFQGLRIMGKDLLDNRTCFHVRAAAACGHAFFQRAAANLAEALAKQGFHALRSAALTVDVLGQNGRVVQLRPKFCGFLPQRLIVMEGGKVCVAGLAVQPAVSDSVVHGFSPPVDVRRPAAVFEKSPLRGNTGDSPPGGGGASLTTLGAGSSAP